MFLFVYAESFVLFIIRYFNKPVLSNKLYDCFSNNKSGPLYLFNSIAITTAVVDLVQRTSAKNFPHKREFSQIQLHLPMAIRSQHSNPQFICLHTYILTRCLTVQQCCTVRRLRLGKRTQRPSSPPFGPRANRFREIAVVYVKGLFILLTHR